MTGMDGSALARAIRSDPSLSKTLLLLMSPVGENAASAARRRKDFDGCLTKPVRPSHLYGASRAALDSGCRVADRRVANLSRPAFQLARPSANPSHDPVRILVVDDNLVNLKVAEKQLQRMGYGSTWLVAARPRLKRCSARTMRSCCSTVRCLRWTDTLPLRKSAGAKMVSGTRRNRDDRACPRRRTAAMPRCRHGRVRRQAGQPECISRSPRALRPVGEECGRTASLPTELAPYSDPSPGTGRPTALKVQVEIRKRAAACVIDTAAAWLN